MFFNNDFLDVDGIKFVVNYDYPTSSKDYIHRIGRTGRSGQKGTSFTFFTEENADNAAELISVLQEANQVTFYFYFKKIGVRNSIISSRYHSFLPFLVLNEFISFYCCLQTVNDDLQELAANADGYASKKPKRKFGSYNRSYRPSNFNRREEYSY